MVKNKKLLMMALGVFLATQSVLWVIQSNKVSLIDNRLIFGEKDDLLAGDIFFTGDTSGQFDPVGCDRLGSLSRRSYLLKKFDRYLYLDCGNFTHNNPGVNRIIMPALYEVFRLMDLKAINLTRRDLINLDELAGKIPGMNLVSAHLEADRNGLLAGSITKAAFLPLVLRNRDTDKSIIVGVTGISGMERKLHRPGLSYESTASRESLTAIQNILERADLRILLFSDSYFELKRLIAEKRLSCDLVIAGATLGEHIDKMIYIQGIPVVFGDEFGRSLGHIRVFKKGREYLFEYESFKIGEGFPEDNRVKALVEEMKGKLEESRHDGSEEIVDEKR